MAIKDFLGNGVGVGGAFLPCDTPVLDKHGQNRTKRRSDRVSMGKAMFTSVREFEGK